MKTARAVLAEQMELPTLREEALLVHIELYFRRPMVHFKKGQLKPSAPKFVTKMPDVDNCVKFTLQTPQHSQLKFVLDTLELLQDQRRLR